MKGSLWLLWKDACIGLATMVLVICGGTALSFYVPESVAEVLLLFIRNFPCYMTIFILLYSCSQAIQALNLSLSLGGRRWDFWLSLQAVALIYIPVIWLFQVAACRASASLAPSHEQLYSAHPIYLLIYAFLWIACLLIGVLGHFHPLSRILALPVVLIASVLTILPVELYPSDHSAVLGTLSWLLPVLLVVLIVVLDALLWRLLRRYCVR